MTASLRDADRAADILLDFIAGGVPGNPMGESRGNYNAVFGSISASDPLRDKTLSEVYEMQAAMLVRNRISTATGRYQGLRATIRGYQQARGLADSVKFTEALQDDFGLQKMIDRGYGGWRAGLIDDDEFMHRLSIEWASLPDPMNGGKSHWDGDSAGNHASTTLSQFRNALREARDAVADPEIPTEAPAPDETPPPNVEAEGIPNNPSDAAVREVQRVLVQTGDLPDLSWVDGVWRGKSQAALDRLVARDDAGK